jgi:hypothetical protein
LLDTEATSQDQAAAEPQAASDPTAESQAAGHDHGYAHENHEPPSKPRKERERTLERDQCEEQATRSYD